MKMIKRIKHVASMLMANVKELDSWKRTMLFGIVSMSIVAMIISRILLNYWLSGAVLTMVAIMMVLLFDGIVFSLCSICEIGKEK